MAIYKRGNVYWYKFMWQGKMIRESSKQGNDKVARNMESAHRTSLAKGEVGIREKKLVPTLKEFCSQRVEPWAKARFEMACRKNWTWYRTGIRALTGYKSLADAHLERRLKAGGALEDRAILQAFQPVLDPGPGFSRNLVFAGLHAFHVDRNRPFDIHAEIGGAAGHVGGIGAGHHGFCGNAAVVDTGAAK